MIKLRGQGYKDSFLHGLIHVLRHINKNAPINNPEAVKTFIASKTDDKYKVKLVDCYALYCKYVGLDFVKPRYRRVRKIPFVPLEKDVDALIGGLTRKHATFCRTIKETGARPGEAWAIKLKR